MFLEHLTGLQTNCVKGSTAPYSILEAQLEKSELFEFSLFKLYHQQMIC